MRLGDHGDDGHAEAEVLCAASPMGRGTEGRQPLEGLEQPGDRTGGYRRAAV